MLCPREIHPYQFTSPFHSSEHPFVRMSDSIKPQGQQGRDRRVGGVRGGETGREEGSETRTTTTFPPTHKGKFVYLRVPQLRRIGRSSPRYKDMNH